MRTLQRHYLTGMVFPAVILSALSGWAEERLIEPGRITQARARTGRIVRLMLSEDGKLRVDQSRWEALAAKSSDEARFAELLALHLRQQVPIEVAERMARATLQREARQNIRPVMRLFEELKTSLEIRSGGSSRSGANFSMRGHRGDVATSLAWHEETSAFHFSIVQSQPTHQALQIDDHTDSGFRFSCTTPQLVLLLVQRPNGSIVATYASDNENHAFACKSFDALRSEHEGFYKRLAAIWDEAGISFP